MPDARDGEDARLLASHDHAALFAAYLPVVQTRVYARVRGVGADDVVQEVFLRLQRELSARKTYNLVIRIGKLLASSIQASFGTATRR